jgi:two-component system, NtrC family, nitrogen regulation sensor histidine kinase NtrY
MIYNRFTLIVILRLLGLTATLVLLAFSLSQHTGLFTSMLLLVLVVAQCWWLLYYLTRTNNELAAFFLGMQEKNTSQAYDTNRLDRQFSNLHSSFKRLNAMLQETRLEKELQMRLHQMITDQVDTGILTYGEQGRILFSNRAAREILGQQDLTLLSQLAKCSADLPGFIDRLTPGKARVYVLESRSHALSEGLPVSFSRKKVKTAEGMVYLLSMQPVKDMLDNKEVESWHKLIRVLTHEMMNSVTPIVTLANNIERCLNYAGSHETESDKGRTYLSDAGDSARMISERSQSLMGFVNSYRDLTLMPEPHPEPVLLKEFLEQQLTTCKPIFQEKDIVAEAFADPPDYKLNVDKKLLSQVMINLIKNATDALDGTTDAAIRLEGGQQNGRPFIRVSDNGPGIAAEHMDAIFVPFFTTRKNGSGIGLSLCRQIMSLHHGSIEAESAPGRGACFTLRF